MWDEPAANCVQMESSQDIFSSSSSFIFLNLNFSIILLADMPEKNVYISEIYCPCAKESVGPVGLSRTDEK